MYRFIFFSFALFVVACSTQAKRIDLVPGIGTVVDSDSILFNSANPKSVAECLNIKDTSQSVGAHYLSYDLEGNEVCEYLETKNIIYKGIKFFFSGPSADSLSLKNIDVNPETEGFDVRIENMSLRNNPAEILKKFPNSLSTDTSQLAAKDYGILFQTDSSNTSKISLVSLHSKL
jgi:hypothetical protein